ncbi:related to Alpha-1,3-mannosyltransferase [Melanopsichium pennsylvanicum]|uniref:Dol-P-Man:Man(5)GlcNAc(2)-PP-Dol alpha-1,3-mannosyltransferase n=1 Tax=Melanopsichium pennsylvanicum TaxID=63383 RepID=A0AAJ4XSS4_9BASI|nr:related to Alpha-1,3-mannosyltransferase [Melanopsichium pennsylvanicum]
MPSQAVTWLRRVCLDDYGYNFALPALIVTSAAISQAVIQRIDFTEIDFQTYVGQAALFLDGERDYNRLDPEGGSGPCVYPAAHLYVYSFFHWLTAGGKNILPAQNVFAGLLTANNLVIALLYRQAGMPPITILPLILSRRISSIFLLRMFNDPIAIFFVYLALYSALKASWRISASLFSVGLGIKMNVLLFLPGIATAAFVHLGLKGAISYVSIAVVVQALISLPFTQHSLHAYLTRAFDFSRAFLYVWTVNWRFLPEATFLSQHFAKGLLAAHLLLLAFFALFVWTPIGSLGPQWILQNLSIESHNLTRSGKVAILCCAFTSNVIGILCSRSLHYQFYSWYFHQVPLLLWFSKLPVVVKLVVPMALEWCWNVFPSTESSSQILLACHIVLVLGCFTLPGPATSKETIVSAQSDVEEDEVNNLLSTDERFSGRNASQDTDSDIASVTEEDAALEREEALQRLVEAREAKVAQESKVRDAFRRRIATRRKILALLGRFSLLLRPLLVAAGLVLVFVVPHPRSPVSKGTYVDENALQPGQARVYWDYFDVTYADMLSEKVAFLSGASHAERADFVYSELQSYGLDVNRQHYQFGAASNGKDSSLSGTNVYARSASPRIDGREAIVLTASWLSQWTGQNDPDAHSAENASNVDLNGRTNVRGVASVLALARYLSTQAHLSKDLIFVISDGYLEGIHAWSSAYFGSVSDGLKVDPVAAGGSQVWNAISIDYPADSFSSLVVQYEGFDGQLPNMDVTNTIVRIADSVAGGMPVNLGGQTDHSVLKGQAQRLAKRWGKHLRQDMEYELGNFEDGVRAALRQVGFGISGQASGPHGFFQRHHVDAITLYAVPATGPFGFFHMGRLIESFVRSMSNLLERLHHSQFLYLLLNPKRFVPIGTAILIPLFLSISLTISGLALWFREEKISKSERVAVLVSVEPGHIDEGDVQPEAPTLGWYRHQVIQKYLAMSDGGEEMRSTVDGHADRLRNSMRPCVAALACVGATVVMGAGLLYFDAGLLVELTAAYGDRAVRVAMLRAAFITLPMTAGPILRSRRTVKQARRIGTLLLAFAYLQAGMLVAVLSVLNFALATLLALLTCAALRIASSRATSSPSASTRVSILSSLRTPVVVLFNPVFWAWIWQSLPGKTLEVEMEKLMAHWKLFGSATVPVFCVAYLPIILQAQLGSLLTG